MGSLAVANAYTMRVCLNLAITQMVRKTSSGGEHGHNDPDVCPEIVVITNTTNSVYKVEVCISLLYKSIAMY